MPKRANNFIRVDESGQAVSSKRRAAVIVNPTYKEAGMNAVLRAYFATCLAFKIGPVTKDIILSCYIFNVTFNVWSGIRQSWNTNGGGQKRVKAIEAKTMTITYHGMILECSAEELHKKVEEQILKVFPDAKTSREIVGTLVTQFCLCNLYYIRYKSLKYSNTLIKTGTKVENLEVKMTNMACVDAGVPLDCVGMLSGINWPPSIRSSLGTSTGPMTPAVLLAKETNAIYQTKLKNLVKRNTAHLGSSGSSAIAEYLAKSSLSESKQVISLLSRILAFVGGRTQERIAFPPSIWSCAMITNDQLIKIGDGLKATKSSTSKEMERMELGEQQKDVVESILLAMESILESDVRQPVNFDFSGDGGLKLYHMSSSAQWEMCCTAPERAMQLHMHATFNYDFEDFSVLSRVTNFKKWEYRSNFTEDFKLLNVMEPLHLVSFTPIRMLYCSKMASANSTSLLSSERSKVNTVHVQSGYMLKNITDEQIAMLTEGTNANNVGSTKEDVVSFLLQIQEKLRKRFETQKSYIQGTTDWFSIEDLEKQKEERNAVKLDIVGSGECYWGLERN